MNEEDHKGPQRWLPVIYSTTECPSPDKGHKRYPYTKLVYSLMLLPCLWRRWAWTIRKLWKQEVCFQDRKKYPQFVSWFVSTAQIAECIMIYYEKNKVKLHFHYNYFPAAGRCFQKRGFRRHSDLLITRRRERYATHVIAPANTFLPLQQDKNFDLSFFMYWKAANPKPNDLLKLHFTRRITHKKRLNLFFIDFRFQKKQFGGVKSTVDDRIIRKMEKFTGPETSKRSLLICGC